MIQQFYSQVGIQQEYIHMSTKKCVQEHSEKQS